MIIRDNSLHFALIQHSRLKIRHLTSSLETSSCLSTISEGKANMTNLIASIFIMGTTR